MRASGGLLEDHRPDRRAAPRRARVMPALLKIGEEAADAAYPAGLHASVKGSQELRRSR